MSRTVRRIAALLALLALSLSIVETGWAAACVATSDGTTGVVVEVGGDGHADHLPPAIRPTPEGADGSVPDAGAGSCPMAVTSGMACGVVALGASATAVAAVEGATSRLLSPPAVSVPSGALSSLFRPPRS